MTDDLDTMTREELISTARRAREAEENYKGYAECKAEKLAAKDALIEELRAEIERLRRG